MKPDIQLGMTVKEKTTGWTGVAICRSQNIVGLERIAIAANMKDGKLSSEYMFDINQLEVIDPKLVLEPTTPPNAKFKFMEKVRDPVTEYEGKVVSRHIYINGCVKIGVQGVVDKKGKVPSVQYFEEPLLESIEPKETKKKLDDSKHRSTGGPGRGEPPRSF